MPLESRVSINRVESEFYICRLTYHRVQVEEEHDQMETKLYK